MDLFLHLESILLQNLSFIIPYMEHPQGLGLADCGDHSSDPWQPIWGISHQEKALLPK
jgi:hypothetical protein